MNKEEHFEVQGIQKELEKLQLSDLSNMLPFFFNLILYVKKSSHEAYYNKIITPLTTRFPSRIIVIIEEDDEHSARQYLNIHVSPVSENNRCEIISIHLTEFYKERIPFLIYPNLISDLPVYLVWTFPVHSHLTILKSIQKLVSRTIFDSSLSTNLNEFFSNASFCSQYTPFCMADLSWTAISSWRRLISAFFDSPEALQGINSCKKIQITYSSNKTSDHFTSDKIQALYLQSWITTSLDWQLRDVRNQNDCTLFYTNTIGQTTEVILQPTGHDQSTCGSIESIEIVPSVCAGKYYFKRVSSKEQISVDFSDIHDCQHCFRPRKNFIVGFQEGMEIIQELFFPPSPKLFLKNFNALKILFGKYYVQ